MSTPVSIDWNIYCDESCHLELDGHSHMVLGAIMCPKSRAKETAERIAQIKEKHGVNRRLELKWTKVSDARLPLYTDIVDYFFDDDDLNFRAIVIEKAQLDHKAHDQTHETFYYKMYFRLLERMLEPRDSFYIYLDIKDTRSASKTRKLGEILANGSLDFHRHIVRNIQNVRSEEIQQIQLADLLIGAVGYANRSTLPTIRSRAKTKLVDLVRHRSGYGLRRTTLLRERKLNLLIWKGAPTGGSLV